MLRQLRSTRDATSDYPGGSAGNELVVEFTLMGQLFVELNGGPDFTPNESVSFMVTTADQEETDRNWDAMMTMRRIDVAAIDAEVRGD